jgi:hypothetical protein
LDGACHESQRTAQIPQTDVTSLGLFLHGCLYLDVELQHLTLLVFLKDAGPHNFRVSINDLPQVTFVIQFRNVDLLKFAPKLLR